MPARLDNNQIFQERIIEIDRHGIKRFFILDTAAYRDGALDAKTKELRGCIVIPHLKHPGGTLDLFRFEDEG